MNFMKTYQAPWSRSLIVVSSILVVMSVANVVLFMLTRPRGMTIRDVVMMPTNFDL